MTDLAMYLVYHFSGDEQVIMLNFVFSLNEMLGVSTILKYISINLRSRDPSHMY